MQSALQLKEIHMPSRAENNMLGAAQSVMASLVWFGIISGECPFVPKNVSIALESAGKVIGLGWTGFKPRWPP
jgi:hypothetical protein